MRPLLGRLAIRSNASQRRGHAANLLLHQTATALRFFGVLRHNSGPGDRVLALSLSLIWADTFGDLNNGNENEP